VWRESNYVVTILSTRRSAPNAEARQAYAAFDRTLRVAVGNDISCEFDALSNSAVAAYAAALREPASRAAWTTFVHALSDVLDALDAAIGIAVDHPTGKSRRELRDIVSENDDLIAAR
jgi:hypothetical protein